MAAIRIGSIGRARSVLFLGVAAAALAGCINNGFDADFRNNGFNTSDAARLRTENRPDSDPRGIISYPSFQVAVARRGDTVATVATRIGLTPDELARYNGLTTGDTLREGEVLALPRRVAEPVGGAGAAGGAAPGGAGPESIDVAAIAGPAIDRAQGASPPPPAARPAGPEPDRHQVKRGETAYSIARLYNVSVKSLAEWNGLGPDLSVREGQYLIIPVATRQQPAQPGDGAIPGVGSPTPEPPSAKEPLPDEKTTPAAAPPKDAPASPDLETAKTSKSRLQMPVTGKIFREYKKGRNEGVDISAAAGATVVAAEAGTVAAITRDTEQVPIVVIRHAGNLLTVYAGLDGIKIAKGDKVARGQAIGVIRKGNPPFLHFEVREGFESTDPLPYLN